MAQHARPAWLIATAAGAGLTAFLLVGGWTRLGSELYSSGLGDWLRGERIANATDSTHLASVASPQLGFVAPALDTPVIPVDHLLPEGDRPMPMNGLCPADMASIDDRFCIDRYEGSLVETTLDGAERPWPYYLSVDKLPPGHRVRAVSERGVYPQGYISGQQAAAACAASGKRLCKPREWKTACKGPEQRQFGYGDKRHAGVCNDNGRSPIGVLHMTEVRNGRAYSSHAIMNDPQLNQLAGTLAETGSHDGCTNGYGVYDMVGNIHEWVDDPRGAFQGGYYLDVEQNGDGCGYKTDAHRPSYHDYSTGFRCCADIGQ